MDADEPVPTVTTGVTDNCIKYEKVKILLNKPL